MTWHVHVHVYSLTRSYHFIMYFLIIVSWQIYYVTAYYIGFQYEILNTRTIRAFSSCLSYNRFLLVQGISDSHVAVFLQARSKFVQHSRLCFVVSGLSQQDSLRVCLIRVFHSQPTPLLHSCCIGRFHHGIWLLQVIQYSQVVYQQSSIV